MSNSQEVKVEGVLLKSYQSKSYKALIPYDVLLGLGILFIVNFRWVCLVVLLILHYIYWKAKNYNIIDIYEDKIVFYPSSELDEVIIVENKDFLAYSLTSNNAGVPAIQIDFLDENGEKRSCKLGCPNAQEIYGFFNTRYLEKNSDYQKQQIEQEKLRQYQQQNSILNKIKNFFASKK